MITHYSKETGKFIQWEAPERDLEMEILTVGLISLAILGLAFLISLFV